MPGSSISWAAKRFELLALTGILAVAALLRLWRPWDHVFQGDRVNFLESDAWYHVRLIENQVHNFPRGIAVDPYASPGGQSVAVAPLFAALVSIVVFFTRGSGASTAYIEHVAAIAPAVMGVLAVAVVCALGTFAFNRRAGLIGGLLAATSPGHFLDRTLLGYVDHHALEVLLSMSTLAALAWALCRPMSASRPAVLGGAWTAVPAVTAGFLLGLYLLTWGSGAYLVAILSLWIVLALPVAGSTAAAAAGRTAALAAAVALLLVVALQDPGLFRYDTQVASLSALLVLSLLVLAFARRPLTGFGIIVASGLVVAAATTVLAPNLARQVEVDLRRFLFDTQRMAVREARPLFMYSGNWTWSEPWTSFRSGFYLGLVAVVALAVDLRQSCRPDRLLVAVFTVVSYVATLGQNRFGYYLVPGTAVVNGWLCARVLGWAGVFHTVEQNQSAPRSRPLRRMAAVIFVLGVAIAPNVVTAAPPTARHSGMPDYWADAVQWFRTATPEPFASDDFYLSRYGTNDPPASYSVMNWWDQGYWLIQAAHRVPVSNPTQSGAGTSATFFTATDEEKALAVLQAERSRFVVVDWELPFRPSDPGALGGHFQNLVEWAGVPASRFYSLCFVRARDGAPWQPVWIFREAYYQTMAYRLMVLGGTSAEPQNNTWVVQIQNRRDADGHEFCEVIRSHVYASAAQARTEAAALGPGFEVVGVTPWQPAFSVPAVDGLRQVSEFRSKAQKAGEPPMVRVFEVTR